MFLSKIFAGTTVVALLACAFLYVQYQRAVAEKEKAEVVAASAESALETMKDQFDKQKETFDLIQKSIKKQQESFDEYFNKVSELESELGKAKQEVSQLRAGELNKALEKPFNRGNAANDRLNSSVHRILGKGDHSPGGGTANSNDAAGQ